MNNLSDLIDFFEKKLFPNYIYYNAELCIIDDDGFIIRYSKYFDSLEIRYEINNVIPIEIQKDINLFIKINKIDKEIMQMILKRLEKRKKIFSDKEPKELLYIENPNLDNQYDEYLTLVKARKKELLLIYENLFSKYFDLDKKISYVWQVNAEKELPELYSLLIEKYKLIASESTYKQFEAVFIGQPIDENFKPIKWHQDNASELLYFITRLEELNNISHKNLRTDYQKLESCFVKPDGNKFKANWKQLKTNLETNLSDDKQKAIDELVSHF